MEQTASTAHVEWTSQPGDASRIADLAFRLANVGGPSRWAWYVIAPLLLVGMGLTIYLRIESQTELVIFAVALLVVGPILFVYLRHQRHNHPPTKLVVDVDAQGITLTIGEGVTKLQWHQIRDVVQIEEFSAIRTDKVGVAFFVPDRAFADMAERNAFQHLIETGCANAAASATPTIDQGATFTYRWFDLYSAARAGWFVRGLLLLILGTATWQILMGEEHPRGSVAGVIGFVAAMGAIMYFGVNAMFATRNWWAWRRTGLAHTLAYDDEAIHIEGGGMGSTIPWEHLKYYKKTGRCYLIWSNPAGGGLIVPRSAFASPTEELSFEAVLQRKLRPSMWYLY